MQLNWIDLVVLTVLLFSAYQGWKVGALRLIGSLLAIIIAFWLSVHVSKYIGMFLHDVFGMPRLWGDIIGYAVIAILAQWALGVLFAYLIAKIPVDFTNSIYNYVAGIVIGLFNGITILAFFLLIFLILPFGGSLHRDIVTSKLGNWIVTLAKQYGGEFSQSIDAASRATSRYITSSPGLGDRTDLSFLPKKLDVTVDAAAEGEMLRLVNAARQKENLPPLTLDLKVREVARNHSRDMFQKQYFSNVDLSGKDGADRMKAAGIAFTRSGENIAYGAEVASVFAQLMNSVGHRQNILNPDFTRIGIGILDAGMYGQMITQDFTD